MALTFASLIATQQKETKALTEKLASLDLEKLLITSLADGSICTGELSNPLINPLAPFTINATNPATLAASLIRLSSLHASTLVGAPILIKTGELASALSVSLKISSLTVQNFKSTGGTNQFLANLTVTFDNRFLVRPVKPLVFTSNIATDPLSPINAKIIIGCSVSGGGKSISCGNNQLMIGINADGSPKCTDSGSQVGAPCHVISQGGNFFGVTSIHYNGQKCCLVGNGVFGMSDGTGGYLGFGTGASCIVPIIP